MSPGQPDATLADAAVIDVGSNSVRLVMYRLDRRAIWTVFNEKVLAGLGRDLASSGRLSADGMATAMNALRRFQALLEASRPAQVHAVATAAIRDAHDGPDFRRRVRVESGLTLRVLSGAEEARYSALGVIAGAPDADGLAADLGGASLELTHIDNGEAGRGVTLPLGPFSFGSVFDPNKVKIAVGRELKGVSDDFRGRTLNVVGGAWRNLALLHMRLADYPLGIVHQYELSRSEALRVARFVEQQSRGSLERIEGISRRRVDALPHAAAVLEGLIEGLGVRRVRVSAFGLREGMLFDAMSRKMRREDPLISGCAALGGRPGPAETLGAALETWLATAFARLDALFGARDRILLAAACRLADFGAQLHPDHRADLVFEQVLRAPIAGLAHDERVYLACAAFGRHTASSIVPAPHVVSRVLTPERYQRARALGAAVRLGCDLSGRSPNLLGHARLDFKPEVVSLQVDSGWEAMLLGEAIAKRAATLATVLGREFRLRPSVARSVARSTVG
ncbi:MAG TPA: Ppx/GppA phosphatase family protein [Caulobacteraceae bacterium]|jgi:exopolyphosphatase/guanosine-5'-triphosphate,3'-diphosphate pyrophosphatase